MDPSLIAWVFLFMAQKRESRRQRRIRKALEKEFPGSKWKKIHGGWFQDAGILDLIGCVQGLYFEFEVKEPDGELSVLQEERIVDITNAGGIAKEIITKEEAIKWVYVALRKAGLKPKTSSKTRN